MEAGIEHLGRGTAIGVDVMIAVVEPSLTSLETAKRIQKLSADIKIKRLMLVGNKIESESQQNFIREKTEGMEIAGFLDYSPEIQKINSGEKSALTVDGKVLDQIDIILTNLETI